MLSAVFYSLHAFPVRKREVCPDAWSNEGLAHPFTHQPLQLARMQRENDKRRLDLYVGLHPALQITPQAKRAR